MLILMGVILEAACLEIVQIGDLRTSLAPISLGGTPVTVLVFWLPFAAAFLVYALGIWKTWKPVAGKEPILVAGLSLTTLTIITFAIVFRMSLLFSPPTLSDDIFRYVWDGRVQNEGVNPYQYAPEAPETAALRDEFWPGINNKHIPTIYPPLLQGVFRTVDLIAHSPFAMKVFFVLCDLGIVFLLVALLRSRGMNTSNVVVYAWNPLVLVEISGSGHNDTLALMLMLGGLVAIGKGRESLSIVLLGLSFVSKFFSVVLLPSLFVQIRRLRPFLLFPAIIVLSYLFYVDVGMQMFKGLMVYGDKWRFNDSVFTLVLEATGSLEGAKIVIGSLFAAVVLARMLSGTDHVRTAYILTGAYLLLTPTLQVWYLVWIVPFLCIYPNPAWILLTALCMLSYNVLIQFVQTGIWHEEEWVRIAQYLPFYTVLACDWVFSRGVNGGPHPIAGRPRLPLRMRSRVN